MRFLVNALSKRENRALTVRASYHKDKDNNVETESPNGRLVSRVARLALRS